MTGRLGVRALAVLLALAPLACADGASLPVAAGYGPDPALPEPEHSLVPTIEVAKARGWTGGETPVPAPGFEVAAFGRGLEHPRWLYVLPNGDVLVAETNGPPTEAHGLRAWLMQRMKQRAGGAVPSANRITLLRDADGDGTPELRTVFLDGLNSPFGMALVGDDLYVANTDALLRFDYDEGDTEVRGPGEKVIALPTGPVNRHWTRNVVASPDGARLYVAVGSSSNAAENGLASEEGRAAILEIDRASGRSRVYASGLRNPVGMSWQPESGALWTAVNERDEIGGDLVPDYMTAVQDGGFYGWPFSYYGAHVDRRVEPQRPDLVARALVPDYALGAHTASLGLAFYRGELLPSRYAGGAFVGQHGSWNRDPMSGYKVIFVPFRAGQPSGLPEDILTGFLDGDGRARGRPVGVAVDAGGALLVADDVGNAVWRVTPSGSLAGR
ncbi:MAG TPA: sorbosone dehydrogenase family protein [Myxococcota bacterium]|nr:sorbosone dehydrogenase family protein [Myxococcota bacterium]